MGTKERLNILKLKLDDEMKIKCRVFKDEDIKKEGNIWYIPGQDGSVKAVKVEPMKTKKDVITELLKRVSNLEFAIENLEKNEQYKYINGQAYFRQDYVIGREKEIDRLNNIINKLQNYLSSKKEMIEVELILDKLQELKGSDKE